MFKMGDTHKINQVEMETKVIENRARLDGLMKQAKDLSHELQVLRDRQSWKVPVVNATPEFRLSMRVKLDIKEKQEENKREITPDSSDHIQSVDAQKVSATKDPFQVPEDDAPIDPFRVADSPTEIPIVKKENRDSEIS